MADPQNIMRLLQGLGMGGTASESYGQGGDMAQIKNGQPVLPKPAISQPGLLSPYAPQHQANSSAGQKPSHMGDSPNSAAGQLARYLATTDAANFHRGAPGG